MLKTSSTKSVEPRKGVVGVGDGGRNRAEPVGKHEVDGNGGVGCSGDFDMIFQVIRWPPGHCSTAKTIVFDCATINNLYLLPCIEALPSWSECQFRKKVRFLGYVVSSHVVLTFRVHPALTSPRCSGRAYQQTHQLARPRLGLSLMGLMLVVVVLLASRSKSRQKVEESSKSPKNLKGLKSCKGHRFGVTFTEAPVLCQRRTRASVRTLTVFQALFAGPKSSFDTTFASIVDKAKLIELLMRCLHQAFICAAHAFPPLLQL